jgi:hypothetical protein
MLRGRYGWGWAVIAWLSLVVAIAAGLLSVLWVTDFLSSHS